MIEISKKFGRITIKQDDKIILETDNADDIREYYESIKDEIEQETVTVETFVASEESIDEGMDMLMYAVMLCWGRQLFHGDCIRLDIKATYEPEDK